jgi:multidrug efflux pump subunit AcrA (membrane-fusion protein)
LKKQKKRRLFIASIIVFAAVVLAIVFHYRSRPQPVVPRTVIISKGDLIVKVSETGTIEPQDEIDIKSKVAGRLLSIPIVEGEHVVKGQLIAIVDRSLIEPQIASTEAELAQGQAKLEQTIAQYAVSKKQDQMAIDTAEAALFSAKTHLAVVRATARPQELAQDQEAVDRAKITLDDSNRNEQRKLKLLQNGFIPQSDYDTAHVAADTAASNLETAEQALSLALAGPRLQDIQDAEAGVNAAEVAVESAKVNALQDLVRKYDIDQARSAVQQTNNNLAQLLVNLGDTTIVAPSSGIVLKKYKQQDEIVQSATTGYSDEQSIVATLGNAVYVDVAINEVDIAKVNVGAPVQIHVDALPDTTFDGTVTSIAPASTNAFNTNGSTNSTQGNIAKFEVAISFNKSDPRLRPGMNANVDIISTDHKNTLLLPLEGLNFDGSSGTVQVLSAGSKQTSRSVKVGLRNDNDAEILSGLNVNDKVVVPPLSQQRRVININGDGDDN